MKKDASRLFVYPKTWVSAETTEIAKSVRRWADAEIVSRRLEYLENFETLFPRARYRLAREIGCQGLMFPADQGGLGLLPEDAAGCLVMILKEIGRADAAIGFIFAMEYALSAVIAGAGDPKGRIYERLAPLFCSESLNSAAVILPGCGPEGETMPLFYQQAVGAAIHRSEAGFRVSGRGLRPLDLGADAAVFAVICADDRARPGVAIVAADPDAVIRGAEIRKTGLEGCANADIDMKAAAVPGGCYLPGERPARSLYSWTNLLLSAVSTGAAMGCLEVASQWAESRVIKGGGLLKDNPLCASVLAEAYEETALAWMLVQNTAYLFTYPEEWGGPESRMIFALARMAGRRVQQNAILAVNRMMELMASEGYAREGRVEKAWRDIKTIQSALCGTGGRASADMDAAAEILGSEFKTPAPANGQD